MIELIELTPKNGRQSFYGKAMVIINHKSDEKTLLSYGTKIVKIKGNQIMRLYSMDNDFTNGVSCTTCSHLISFCGYHKQDFIKLPYRKWVEIKK
jgi:hypothetical protein